jgi:SAM-dependent methyltransferase
MADPIESITQAIFRRGKDLDLFDDAAIARTSFACEGIRKLDRIIREGGIGVARDLPGIARAAARRFERAVGERDQFYSFSAAQEDAVLNAYSRFCEDLSRPDLWTDAASKRLGAAVVEHRLRLRSAFARPLRPSPCFYYGAIFQLALLGIDAAALEGPVLDLGCGPDATLVEGLRSLGIEATGVDRSLRRPGPYLVEADWMDFPLPEGAWGAVVSHMAFSNHFARRRLESGGRDIAYARRYREILISLRPGGTFYYAPSLPFIERFVDREEFSVETREVAPGLGTAAIRRRGGPPRKG